MAFVISDRIKMTSTTTGTGTLTLVSAVTGFGAFSLIGDGNTTSYAIIGVDANGVPTGEWETGIGTYTASGTTLSRGVIKSSNSNALVNFSAGTKHVICADVAGYSTPLVMATTASRAIQVADQTALSTTAGNARGTAAVDLQIKRSGATLVASGNYSTIGGGRNNRASGTASTVCGGQYNVATSFRSTVCGGTNNTSSNYQTFVGGGTYNTASASWSVVAGGYENTASQTRSAVLGGRGNTASGSYSVVLGGARGVANKHGQCTMAPGRFSTSGDAQTSHFVLFKQTTTAVQAEMFLDNSSAQMSLSNDTTWAFDILVVARRTDANDESAAWKFAGCIDRNASAAATAIVGAVTKTVLALDTAGWDVDVTADTTGGALRIRVTGSTSKTINWVAFVRTVETTG